MQRWNVSQENVSAWLIAAILCVNTFAKVLGTVIIIPYNIVLMEIAAMIALVICNEGKVLFSKAFTVILIVVACIMGYSLLLRMFDMRVIERLLKFVMYAFFAMFCIQYPFHERTLQKAIFAIGLLHAVYLFGYAMSRLENDLMSLDDTMDLSYTTLIYLFTASDFVVNRRERGWLRLFALAMSLLFFYFLIGVSSNRGALLAAGCFYGLRWVTRCRNKSLRVLLLVCMAGMMAALALNFITVLEAINDWTTSKGFVITPIRKTLWQQRSDQSTASGREVLYAAAIQLIKDSWALPNGVAGCDILTQLMYYPHNIFLEAGVELGFAGFILVGWIIIKACYMMVIEPRKYSRWIILFFCLSIPRLMVSSSYWENSYIWPMMVLMWSKETM